MTDHTESAPESATTAPRRPITLGKASWSYEYDPDARAVYLEVRNGTIDRTEHLGNGVIVDLDRHGNVLGVEVLLGVTREEVERYRRFEAEVRAWLDAPIQIGTRAELRRSLNALDGQ